MARSTHTPDVVITRLDEVTQKALTDLSNFSVELHEQGFHKASTHVANLRWRIEKSFEQTVDQILEDQA